MFTDEQIAEMNAAFEAEGFYDDIPNGMDDGGCPCDVCAG